jgi:hypothetical protein
MHARHPTKQKTHACTAKEKSDLSPKNLSYLHVYCLFHMFCNFTMIYLFQIFPRAEFFGQGSCMVIDSTRKEWNKDPCVIACPKFSSTFSHIKNISSTDGAWLLRQVCFDQYSHVHKALEDKLKITNTSCRGHFPARRANIIFRPTREDNQ